MFRFAQQVAPAARRHEYDQISGELDARRGFKHSLRHLCRDDWYAAAAYRLSVNDVVAMLRANPLVDPRTVHISGGASARGTDTSAARAEVVTQP